MGRLMKNTTVKVDGQAGPLGQGVPLSKAAGPGGIAMTGSSKNPQIPGFKELMAKRFAVLSDNKARLSRGLMFSNLKPGQDKLRSRLDQLMNQRKNKFGLFTGVLNKVGQQEPEVSGGMFSNLAKTATGLAAPVNPNGPVKLASNPTGGLISKPTIQSKNFS